MRKRVFISYSRRDKAFADRLRDDLGAEGIDVWQDVRALEGGKDWWQQTKDGITHQDIIVACLSPPSAKSPWVRREIALARRLHKRIIPVIVKNCFSVLSQHRETKSLLKLQMLNFAADGYEHSLPLLLRAVLGEAAESAVRRVFASNDSTEFRQYVEQLMIKADRIVMVGTGLVVLHNDTFRTELLRRAAKQECELEVYLADPNDPSVQTRLIEEELGSFKPPVGRAGLIPRIENLVDAWKKSGAPDSVRIRLFRHYPTFALLIVDDDYFVYPYGHAILGNFSPVLQLSKRVPADSGFIRFLDDHYARVRQSAVKAAEVMEARTSPPSDVTGLLPFAVFLIPPAGSQLYQFGSNVLGYDIRDGERPRLPSPYEQHVGTAKEYGFHLTLCDVLYFRNPSELKLMQTEVEFLTREFAPFRLGGLRIETAFPDPKCISLALTDPTGSLEALHHEFVQRLYRRAAASNYTLGVTMLSRDQEEGRAELMLRRYRAPYILQKFKPHFTLAAGVSSDAMESCADELRTRFAEEVMDRRVRVDRLAIVTREEGGGPWRIADELPLGWHR